jgi:MATE family multidrug resistance protein
VNHQSASNLSQELRHFWRIGWPLLIAQTAQMGTGVVDTIMAARFGDKDLAAIAIGFNIWLPLYLLVLGVMFASAAIIAQDFGAGRLQRIRDQLPQTLWVSVLLSCVVAPICYFSYVGLHYIGIDAATAEKASEYIRMVAFGFPAIGIFMALRYHTQGVGITSPFAVASVIGFIANIPLNYMFIFGLGDIPAMGAQGCGIATAISMWLSAIIISIYVLTKPSIQQYLPPWKPVAPNLVAIKEILLLGAPVGATMFMETGVFAVIALMVSSLGDVAIGAHQIAFNVWDMFYIPMLSIGAAMATRMGHAIGAQDKPGVYMALRAGLLCSITVSLITMVILLSFPDTIVGVYSESPAMKVLAARLLTFAALFVIIDAIQIVGSFAMRAYKKTRFPFIASMVAYWGIALPLGYYLGLVRATNASDGAAGFWIAIILGVFVATIMVAVRVIMLLRQPLPKDFEAMPES